MCPVKLVIRHNESLLGAHIRRYIFWHCNSNDHLVEAKLLIAQLLDYRIFVGWITLSRGVVNPCHAEYIKMLHPLLSLWSAIIRFAGCTYPKVHFLTLQLAMTIAVQAKLLIAGLLDYRIGLDNSRFRGVVNPCHAEYIKMLHPLLIFSQSDYLIPIVGKNLILLANSADSDKLASSSGSTLFAKAARQGMT